MIRKIMFLVFLFLFQNVIIPQDTLKTSFPDLQLNNDAGFAKQYYSNALKLSNGNYLLVWRDHRNGGLFSFYQKFDKDGNRIGENMEVVGVPGYAEYSSNGNGKIIVCWSSGTIIRTRMFDEDFNPISEIYEIDTGDNNTFNSYSYQFDVSMRFDGQFMVVWAARTADFNHSRIFGQKFNENLEPESDITKIFLFDYSEDYMFPVIAVNNAGKYVISAGVNSAAGINIYVQLFSDDIELAHVRVNDTEAEYKSVITADSSYSFYVMFIGEDNEIYTQKFSNNGEKIGENIQVENVNSSDRIYNLEAATNIDGKTLLSWTREDSNYSQVFMQGLDTNLTSIYSSPININDTTGATLRQSMSIMFKNNKNFIITWHDEFYHINSDIYLKNGSIDGFIEDNLEVVNDDFKSGDALLSKISGQNVRLNAVWSDRRSGDWMNNKIFYRSRDFLGQLTVETEICSVCRNALVENISNEYSLILFKGWMDLQIYGTLIDLSNQTGDVFSIIDDGHYPWTSNFSISSNNFGYSVVAWGEDGGRPPGTYFQLFDSTITKIGTNHYAVKQAGNTNIDCTLDDMGRVGILYISYERIMTIQRFDQDGNNLGDTLLVLDDGLLSPTVDRQISLVTNPITGRLAVVWIDDRDGNKNIFVQIFDSEGNKVGNNILVNDDINFSKQENPAVAMDEHDNFIVAWTDYRNGSADVYAQLFLKNGTAWKNNFRVNEDTLRNQEDPSVDFDGNKIFFSWTTNHRDGRGKNVWSKAYEWDTYLDVKTESENVGELSLDVYPNPFNAETTVRYFLPNQSKVKIDLYDVKGEKVSTIENLERSRGLHEVRLNGINLSSGIYFLTFEINGNMKKTEKIVLMK